MPIVIKTELGYVTNSPKWFSRSVGGAKKFCSVKEAMRVRDALATRWATVIRTAPPRRYRNVGIDVIPTDDEEAVYG